MESEKMMYWVTLGVLAMAAITSAVTGHAGWGEQLADRSIAVMSRASAKATSYAEIARVVLGSGEEDSVRPVRTVVEAQNRQACVQRVLVRRQAELVRLQAMRIRVRALERAPRTIVWPTRNMVIEIPQAPQTPEDTF
ncbi:MAG: hypothetical protein LAO18_10240 [Acidobacteriia bacterium]|nr:hypothetical protein [Terriglobia bacterium]